MLNPEHAAILAALGAANDTSAPQARQAAVNFAVRSPLCLVFIANGNQNCICVDWEATFCPADLASPCDLENKAMVMLGNDINTSMAVVIPDNAFACTGEHTAHDMGCTRRANGHGTSDGPVFRFDHAASGTDHTNDFQTRQAFPLSADTTLALLPCVDNVGRIALLAFHQTALKTDLGSADAAVVTTARRLRDWCCMAVMNSNAANTPPHVGLNVVTPEGLPATQALAKRASHTQKLELTKLGVGEPGLTTAAFQQGMNELRQTHQELNQATLDHHTQRDHRSFSAHHGEALAEQAQNQCQAPNDAGLPEVHHLTATFQKHQVCGILTAKFQNRASESTMPLTLANAPLATPKMVDGMFCNCTPGGTGPQFGDGLTPIGVVCEGHQEHNAIVCKINQATRAKQGSSVSLRGAEILTATAARFLTDTHTAAEKLCGWLAIFNVFHGSEHPTATAIDTFVRRVAPCRSVGQLTQASSLLCLTATKEETRKKHQH